MNVRKPKTLGESYRAQGCYPEIPPFLLELLRVASVYWSLPAEEVPAMTYTGDRDYQAPCCHHGAQVLWLYAQRAGLTKQEAWELTLHHGWNHCRLHSFLVCKNRDYFWILDPHPCASHVPVLLGPYLSDSQALFYASKRVLMAGFARYASGENCTGAQLYQTDRRYVSTYATIRGKRSLRETFELLDISYLDPTKFKQDCRNLLHLLLKYINTPPAPA